VIEADFSIASRATMAGVNPVTSNTPNAWFIIPLTPLIPPRGSLDYLFLSLSMRQGPPPL
jgi:hypothetical protein